MNNWNALIAAILLLSGMVFVTQSAMAENESLGMANASLTASHNVTELVSFVKSAMACAKENGKEKALKEFNNKTGSFVNDELYIFASDFNGTVLATFKPDWIGQNKFNVTDPNGVLFLRNEINALKRRVDTFNYLIFSNPAHNNKNELELAYLMKMDDSWFIGSGLYLSNISASFDQKEREELVSLVNEALRFAKENGKQKALEVFNDPKGNFTRNGRYIFADDYEGTNLALPYQPEKVGTSLIDAQDLYGVQYLRQLIDVARTGNGFVYYIYPDPSRNMTQTLKLSYVADVDGTWFLGSGIYAKGEM